MQIGILNILDNFHRSDEIRETYHIFKEPNSMSCSWYLKEIWTSLMLCCMILLKSPETIADFRVTAGTPFFSV